MDNINLLTGPAGSYYYFKDKIIEHVQNDTGDSYIYILPVNRAVRYLKKELVDKSGTKALIDPPVYTFPGLIHLIYLHLENRKKVIPAALRLIHLKRILEKYGDQLEYLKFNNSAAPGFISRIDKMLSELSQFGYRPGNFGDPPDTAENRYRDLEKLSYWLYEKYGDEFIDETMLPSEVAAQIDDEAIKNVFPGLQSVYINGYGIYTPPMLKILGELAKAYNVFVKLEYDVDNPVLFAHTKNAYDALSRMAGKNKNIAAPENSLHRSLFYTTKSVPELNMYSLQAVKNRDEEVRYIAVQIRKLHYQNKIPLHKFGITFPDIEKYAPRIRKIFGEYDIPFNLSTGYSLAQSPLVQAYLQVFKVLTSGYDVAEMIKLLNSPFLLPDLHIDVILLQKLIRQYNLHYFNTGWEEKVIPQSEDEHRLMAGVQKIIGIISQLDRSIPYSEFPVLYFSILDQLGMLSWFKRDQIELTRTEKEREFRAYNRFYKILNIMGMAGTDESLPLRKFNELLYLIIRDASYNLREWSNYGVQCMPRLEIQSIECDVLFIGGLVEGEFPRAYSRDIFFNDQERQQLGLYAVEDLLSQDRFLFYQLLSSSARQIFLIHPSFEEEANLLPSSFIRNLRELNDAIQYQTENDELSFLNRRNLGEHIFKNTRHGIEPGLSPLIRQWGMLSDSREKSYLFEVVQNLFRINDRIGFTKFEGDLSGNSLIISRLEKETQKKTYSITGLELYAFCPMRYFLKRIMDLEEEEEETIQFTALERGALLHKIFFKFYTALKEKNQQDQPWQYANLLKDIARRYIDQIHYSGIFWTLEQETILGTAGKQGLLDVFLEVEQMELAAHDYKPQFFEYGFGLRGNLDESDAGSEKNAFTITEKDREIRVAGKIDRIDVHSAGDIVVIDYKTGKGSNPAIKDIDEGISLQLPVYMAVVNKVFRNSRPVAGIYYQVHDADNCKRIVAVVDVESNPDLLKRGDGRLPNKKYPISLDELIHKSVLKVAEHVENIERGEFTHTKFPDRENCRTYCPYKRICRKDVGKLSTMDR